MKKFLQFLLPFILLSCTNQSNISVDITPPLTISTFVYDETSDDYILTPLEQGVVYNHIANCGGGMVNINILLSCANGSAQIVSEDHNIQLSIGNGATIYRSNQEERSFGYDFKISNEGYVAAIPYGSPKGEFNFVTSNLYTDMHKTKEGYVGKKYILDVYGYELGHQVVHAELTLTQVEDPDFPNGDNSGRFSIEMTAYEYSDRYLMMLE